MRKRTKLLFLLLLILVAGCIKENEVVSRSAGTYFPANPSQLYPMIEAMESRCVKDTTPKTIEMCLVPHAAYRYAGEVIASGYAQLSSENYASYKRIVVICGEGPGDTLVPSFSEFVIPGGKIPIDLKAAGNLLKINSVLSADDYFSGFAAIEVHLPFILKHYPGLPVLPIVMGQGDNSKIFETINGLTGDSLLILSLNLSTLELLKDAEELDGKIIESLSSMKSPDIVWKGSGLIGGAIELLKSRPGTRFAKMVGYSNDVPPLYDNGPVTTYGAFIFYKQVEK